ncbi:MAG: Gfo/Idh/MocA family oxidoreductase [Candidatus Curtissbacteria bacterium]|nr:Gfo/Idh/MocA family oxidoreductase [Candidatus Curtissbacteria bacterium]
MSKNFNVLIVGSGRIGAFIDDPKSKNILSHAHGFSQNGFNLVGFVDRDFEKARKASSIWGGLAFKTIGEAFNKNKIDVVCEAVDDEYHFEVLKELLPYNFKLVFAEKPLASSDVQAKKILDLYKKRGTPIAVNYTRRYIPEFEFLKLRIPRFGKFVKGTGIYGKGLIHNGSHMIDLLRYLVGEIVDITVYERIFDYSVKDPSLSGILKLESGSNFAICALDCRLYTIFEMDLLFEKGRIKIDDSKFMIEEFGIKENSVFSGYKNLTKSEEINTSQDKSMLFASKNIYEFLKGNSQLKCTGEEAYKTLQSCFKFK